VTPGTIQLAGPVGLRNRRKDQMDTEDAVACPGAALSYRFTDE
jgi:hypothetical protein